MHPLVRLWIRQIRQIIKLHAQLRRPVFQSLKSGKLFPEPHDKEHGHQPKDRRHEQFSATLLQAMEKAPLAMAANTRASPGILYHNYPWNTSGLLTEALADICGL